MADSRAADYIAFGLNRGVDRFLEGIEKHKEEEKNRAREFKSLVEFLDATGWMNKDQAITHDLEGLKGFARGKMYNDEIQRQNQANALHEFELMRKMQGDQAIGQLSQDYANNVQMGFNPQLSNYYENPEAFGYKQPAADPLAAFTDAMARNPAAAADERFGAVTGAMRQLEPKQHVPTPFTQLIQDYNAAVNEGRDKDAELYQQKLAKEVAPTGMQIEFDDNGHIHAITQGAIGPTKATQGKLEQSVQNARKGLDMMGELTDKLDWKDVGPAGVFGENIMDKLLPAFGANTMSKERVDNRTKLRTLIQTMARQVNPDNRFSNEDRKKVEEIMPSTGILENKAHAQQVLATLMRVFAKRNIRDMQAMGKPIKPEDLNSEEIGAAVEMGIIPLEQAKEILRSRPN